MGGNVAFAIIFVGAFVGVVALRAHFDRGFAIS